MRDEASKQTQPDDSSGPSIKGKFFLTQEELERLSPVEREIWLAKHKLDLERRQRLRREINRPVSSALPDPSNLPGELQDDLRLDSLVENRVRSEEDGLAEFGDEQTRRFKPAGFKPARVKPRPSRPVKNSPRWLDYLGWTLEGLVILAVLVVVGNWLLQQAGISIDLFGGGQNQARSANPSRSEGLFLNVMAEGDIFVPPTPTSAPNTPLPPSPTPRMLLPTEQAMQVIAPTPTPYIVRPALPQAAKPKYAPPARLLIPRIALDIPVQEVTVNLGNWQVADYAAGFHQGTANAGDNSNMVLAGHRDVRGSVFLRLNEMRPGDEIRVFSAVGSYRYLVTEILEVAPTEVSVMGPTAEATATLITCTPIGLATKRLVVRARLAA
jgi:sortase A